MTDLNQLTISSAHEGLKKKKFSSEELTRACFKRIGERNKDIFAFVEVFEDRALAQAKVCDKDGIKGYLSGIPFGIKDNFCAKGYESTAGSRILRGVLRSKTAHSKGLGTASLSETEGFKAPYDATVIARLRKEGAVFIGRTNMDEFACGSSTEHSCYGVTKNPHDLERVPGGSSGGSAAAIADNMCLGAIGTDTGGSVRQPASLCGCYGFKPTYGRVSRYGVMALASSWDVVGSFARSVKDIAIIMQTLAGKDSHDATMPDKPVSDYLTCLTGDVKGLRIGVPKEYFGEGVTDEVKTVVMNAIDGLKKRGAKVKEVSLPTTKYAVAAYYVSMPAELSANLARYDGIRFGLGFDKAVENLDEYYQEVRGAGFGPEIKRRIIIGTYLLSAGYYDAYYKKAQQVRTLIIEDFNRVFKEVDVLCAPVSPFPAFKLGENLANPLAMYMADALTIPVSTAGLPALSVPCGVSGGGLPIGLQIIGRQFEEEVVMKVGEVVGK